MFKRFTAILAFVLATIGLSTAAQARSDEVMVQLDGGVLEIDWDQSANQITMTGGASHAFSGQLSADLLHD